MTAEREGRKEGGQSSSEVVAFVHSMMVVFGSSIVGRVLIVEASRTRGAAGADICGRERLRLRANERSIRSSLSYQEERIKADDGKRRKASGEGP